MALDITTPIAQSEITTQGIVKLEFIIPHKVGATPDTMIFDKTNIQLSYIVITWDDVGEVVLREQVIVKFADWPIGFKNDIKAAYAKVETHAQSLGYIGVGTPESLED